MSHTQNMSTFIAWCKFWNSVVVFAQSRVNETVTNNYKKSVIGFLVPVKKNKYFNVLYFTIIGFYKLNNLNKKFDFSVFQASDAGAGILALLLSKIHKKKFVFEIQGDIFEFPSEVGGRLHSNLVKMFSRFLATHADHIRIVSPYQYKYLSELGVDSSKIYLVPPRCESKVFNLSNIKSKPDIFSENSKNIIFVGNLIVSKGVIYLIEAVSNLIKKGNEFNLIIVGDGALKDSLVQLSKKLNIKKNVFFVGRIKYELVPTYIHYADLLVLPSIEEGVGRVLIEAMALKVPVVGSNVGGIPLLIEENFNGLLFESRNSHSLEKKIEEIFEYPKKTENMILNAYSTFINNYEFDISMKQFIKMFEDIEQI